MGGQGGDPRHTSLRASPYSPHFVLRRSYFVLIRRSSFLIPHSRSSSPDLHPASAVLSASVPTLVSSATPPGAATKRKERTMTSAIMPGQFRDNAATDSTATRLPRDRATWLRWTGRLLALLSIPG